MYFASSAAIISGHSANAAQTNHQARKFSLFDLLDLN